MPGAQPEFQIFSCQPSLKDRFCCWEHYLFRRHSIADTHREHVVRYAKLTTFKRNAGNHQKKLGVYDKEMRWWWSAIKMHGKGMVDATLEQLVEAWQVMLKSPSESEIPPEFELHTCCMHIKAKTDAHKWEAVKLAYRFARNDLDLSGHGPSSPRLCAVLAKMKGAPSLTDVMDKIVETMWANETLQLQLNLQRILQRNLQQHQHQRILAA